MRPFAARLTILFLALAVAGPIDLLTATPVAAADASPAASEEPATAEPTPTPSPSPTPTPDAVASPTPTPTPDDTEEPAASPTPTPGPTATPTPDPSPTPDPTPTPAPSPTPTPFGRFTSPAAGPERPASAGATTVTWTESAAVTNRTLRQYYGAAVSGRCTGVTWARAWTRAVASRTATVRKLVPGICYRYTLTASTIGTGSVVSVNSGVVRVPGSWTGTFDLYRGSAFATQLRWYWCVPASVQMMLNLINGQSDHSWTNQSRYYLYGRPRRARLFSSNGLDPQSWMLTLNRFGGGDYRVVTSTNLWLLMRYAARRNRLTGKPVGLLVARGGHAWVMTGFKATGDPAISSSYRLTSIRTMGPLWPRQRYRNRFFDSPPGAWFSIATVSTFYGRYRDRLGSTPWDGKYVIVAP